MLNLEIDVHNGWTATDSIAVATLKRSAGGMQVRIRVSRCVQRRIIPIGQCGPIALSLDGKKVIESDQLVRMVNLWCLRSWDTSKLIAK